MTAVFSFKDESAVKARQTVFFAYKSPEASSSFEKERERLWCDAIQFGKIYDKNLPSVDVIQLASDFRLLNTDIPGFNCVYVLHNTAKGGGSLHCVFVHVYLNKFSG